MGAGKITERARWGRLTQQIQACAVSAMLGPVITIAGARPGGWDGERLTRASGHSRAAGGFDVLDPLGTRGGQDLVAVVGHHHVVFDPDPDAA